MRFCTGNTPDKKKFIPLPSLADESVLQFVVMHGELKSNEAVLYSWQLYTAFYHESTQFFTDIKSMTMADSFVFVKTTTVFFYLLFLRFSLSVHALSVHLGWNPLGQGYLFIRFWYMHFFLAA